MKLRVIPLTLKEANIHIAKHHRHHKRVVGHRFSLGCLDGDRMCACVVVGRPVGRNTDQRMVAEVTRLCTDGTMNSCSILYAAAARACKSMGFWWIQTFTLPEEGGASLRASGWTEDGESPGGSWSSTSRPRGEDEYLFPGIGDDHPKGPKTRWKKILNPEPASTEEKP